MRIRRVKNSDSVLVSVVMPCWNEERFIGQAIESLMDDYFREHCELIAVDGMSDDRTREIIEGLRDEGICIKLLENPNRTQAYGLNLGIKAARGKYIVRADAHCVYPPGYVRKCIELLEETGAGNAGGRMLPMGMNDGQQAIALAFQHPMGVGDARWHLGNFQGDVDRVYLGTYRRDLFDEIGLFDTNCRTNEDAELDIRILKAGKRVYLDSSIQVVYFPRETFKKLIKQYFFYGKGRAYTTLKHKRITSWRQLAPQAILGGLIVSLGLSFWKPLFLLIPLVYAASLVVIALLSWRRREGSASERKISLKQRFLMAAACGIMHVSWGVGFMATCLSSLRPRQE